jgi:hypothetical protein
MTMLVVLPILAVLQIFSAPATVSIASDSSCPSADAVRASLDVLGGGEPPRSAEVMVRNRDGRLVIEFGWPGSGQVESRELSVAFDCQSRAQAAAVVVASWLGLLPQASLESPPLGLPASEPYVGVLPPTSPGKAVPPAPASPTVAARPPMEPTRAWLGLGLGTTAGGGVVPGLRAEFSRGRPGTGTEWSWLASTFASLPRARTVGGGTSRWIRPGIGLAGVVSWHSRRLQLSLDLGPLGGLTVAWGEGYPVDQTSQSLTWGWSAGLRGQLVSPSSRFWIDVRAINWLRAQELQHAVQPSGRLDTNSLPSWEAQLMLGWSLSIFDGDG